MYTKNTKTITIKIDSDYIQSDDELKALCVLLGGYNKYGRKMDIENLSIILDEFNTLLNKVSSLTK